MMFKPAQADNGPIRTVTRREIVPGTYGRVRVTQGGYVHCHSMRSTEEIDDAILVLSQIREVWEENK